MLEGQIHVGDNVLFEVTVVDEDDVVVPLQTATTLEFIFREPNSTSSTSYTASYVTDGSDGKLKYITQAADLDVKGIWLFQVKVIMAGRTYRSDIEAFRVLDNI